MKTPSYIKYKKTALNWSFFTGFVGGQYFYLGQKIGGLLSVILLGISGYATGHFLMSLENSKSAFGDSLLIIFLFPLVCLLWIMVVSNWIGGFLRLVLMSQDSFDRIFNPHFYTKKEYLPPSLIADEIENLDHLFQLGAITFEELEKRKRDLLSN